MRGQAVASVKCIRWTTDTLVAKRAFPKRPLRRNPSTHRTGPTPHLDPLPFQKGRGRTPRDSLELGKCGGVFVYRSGRRLTCSGCIAKHLARQIVVAGSLSVRVQRCHSGRQDALLYGSQDGCRHSREPALDGLGTRSQFTKDASLVSKSAWAYSCQPLSGLAAGREGAGCPDGR